MAKYFDPNGAAEPNSGVFGFRFTEEESELILIPVPWDATCSYGDGASKTPKSLFNASKYVELYDSELKDFYNKGIYYVEEDENLVKLNASTSKIARPIIESAGTFTRGKQEVDAACLEMIDWTEARVDYFLQNNKKFGLIGGDHSITQGGIKAVCKKYKDVGILQIDAHSDLRTEFESLKYSHASVMLNVLNETPLKNITQVGIRGYCEEEYTRILESKKGIQTFYSSDIHQNIFNGMTWNDICIQIIETLPHDVYISFDIDGLEISNCPNTGTLMPGGLSYESALYLLKMVSEKRNIVGFDLVEVSCGKEGDESIDAIVASNLLYKLCGFTLTCLGNK